MNNTQPQTYNVDYFIAKFEAIPEKEWIVGQYINATGCDALGHCGWRSFFRGKVETVEGLSLNDLFIKSLGVTVYDVNDSKHYGFTQDSPKQRILAALRDIKAKQEQASN
jgi:hypothetical protein